MMGWKPNAVNAVDNVKGFQEGDHYVTQLSQEIGKSKQYIYDHINLLKERPEVMEWFTTAWILFLSSKGSF